MLAGCLSCALFLIKFQAFSIRFKYGKLPGHSQIRFPCPPGASSQVWTYGEEHHHVGSRGTDGCPRWGAYAVP